MPPRKSKHVVIGPIRRLPAHILTRVLSFLPQDELPATMLVSRAFFNASVPLLYTHLRLTAMPYDATVHVLSTIVDRTDYARHVKSLQLDFARIPNVTPANLDAYAERLQNALQSTCTTIQKLSIPDIPSIYHWVLSNTSVQLSGLTHLEVSVYLAVNCAATFLQRHCRHIRCLRLCGEWAGSDKGVTMYHGPGYFDVKALPRMKDLRWLAVDIVFAPDVVRKNVKSIQHLIIEDHVEPWNAAENTREKLKTKFGEIFKLLNGQMRVASVAIRMRKDIMWQDLKNILQDVENLHLVVTLTLFGCPWSNCECRGRRIVETDSEPLVSITSHFPDLKALRFFCAGRNGTKIHMGIWPCVAAIAFARQIEQPKVQEIEYEGDARGVSIFWHRHDTTAGQVEKSRHPFNIILTSSR